MAIQKEKELGNGTVGNYWIAEPKGNALTKMTEVLLLLFKDKATRDAGKTFLLRERVPSITGTFLTGEEVYTAIKESKMSEATEEEESVETNWFADSVDC